MMKNKASSIFSMLPLENEEEDVDLHLNAVVKQITKELSQRKFDGKWYSTLNKDNLFDECSATLMNLLPQISTKFDCSSSSAMIGSIVTGVYTGHHTRLQLAKFLLILRQSLGRCIGVIVMYHTAKRPTENGTF